MPAPHVAGGGGGETRETHPGGLVRAMLQHGVSGSWTSPKVRHTGSESQFAPSGVT